jgi:hypothetical protein
MVSVFVPVLWACINANCNFMQAIVYFQTEAQCQQSMENQKLIIRKQSAQAGVEIDALEGTCITVNIKKEFLPANIKKETT